MKINYVLILVIFCFLHSCQEKDKRFNVSLNSESNLDTIYVSEVITGNKIIQLHNNSKEHNIHLNSPIIAKIYDKNRKNVYLTILESNKDLNIFIKSNSRITTNDKSDSLVNYLWKSNNEFISKHNKLLFGSNNLDTIPKLFEKFRRERKSLINKHKNQFSSEILEILHFQNDARIYSFLFYYGRLVKEIQPNNRYFNFIDKIPHANETLKTLPDIYLYKYEVEYLRKNKSIESISHFLQFIEEKTNNNELADFLKANYIKALIELPSYWEKHEKLFNTEVLTQSLTLEKNNLYYNIIEQPSSSFYASQNGEMAYLFQAEDEFGNHFSLENYRGKVIFIDTWATWCGPCINHRPKVLEFAKKYKNNDDVEILFVSVDSSKDKWVSFLDKENQKFGKNLFIENGMRTEFGKNYNIKSIPRYILIGKNGKIINSNIKEPSLIVENEIEKALKEN